jgi:Isocitrate/isopropylmalate dehydrogenase
MLSNHLPMADMLQQLAAVLMVVLVTTSSCNRVVQAFSLVVQRPIVSTNPNPYPTTTSHRMMIPVPQTARRPSTSSSSTFSLYAVPKKDQYNIAVLPGDGIGPEITQATRFVLDALCQRCHIQLQMTEGLIGGAAIDARNDPFPIETLQLCQQSDSILLACIGGYQWDNNPRELRPESGLLRLRQSLGLYANLRPAKVLPQLIDASTLKPHVIENVDIMVVRELTGDVYFGTPKGIDTIDGTMLLSLLWLSLSLCRKSRGILEKIVGVEISAILDPTSFVSSGVQCDFSLTMLFLLCIYV